MGRDEEIRTALERHWAASVAGDLDTEHEIYHDDVLVEYPQSGERIRGRDNLRAVRVHHPSRLEYAVHRIRGQGDVWVTECVSGYGRSTVRTVSVMEFADGRVRRETQYYAEPFDAPQWRMPWVETGEPSADQSDPESGSS